MEKSSVRSQLDESICGHDQINKETGKQHSDEKWCAKEANISVREDVLLKQKKLDKSITNFEQEPYRVEEAGFTVAPLISCLYPL